MPSRKRKILRRSAKLSRRASAAVANASGSFSEQFGCLGLGLVQRLLGIDTANQDRVHRRTEDILNLRILRNAWAVFAIATDEGLVDHRQEAIFGEQVRVMRLADAEIAAGTLQVHLLVDGWVGDPLNENPGGFLLLLIDVVVDGEAPAANAVFLRQPFPGRRENDAGLADDLRLCRIVIAGGTDRPGLHVGGDALTEGLLAPAPIVIGSAGRRRLGEQVAVGGQALHIGVGIESWFPVLIEDGATHLGVVLHPVLCHCWALLTVGDEAILMF